MAKLARVEKLEGPDIATISAQTFAGTRLNSSRANRGAWGEEPRLGQRHHAHAAQEDAPRERDGGQERGLVMGIARSFRVNAECEAVAREQEPMGARMGIFR